MSEFYPLGKLPPGDLDALLRSVPSRDPRVILGPRTGEDCAVIDVGAAYLVAKTDPITFATDEIGWYAVNVNANDIATTGAKPAWFMAAILLPEGQTDKALVKRLLQQVIDACEALDITLVGGHTEVTYGIDRPIITGTMFGTVAKDQMVTTGGAQVGDVLLLTKGVPIEATALIAREKADQLKDFFDEAFIAACADYLHTPGISVVKDARIAQSVGRVHAMHDPTEGGISSGLWEMAEASGKRLVVQLDHAIDPAAKQLCEAVGLNPLHSIGSGALLMAVHPDDAGAITSSLEEAGIPAFMIGHVEDGDWAVLQPDGNLLPRPLRDDITKLYE